MTKATAKKEKEESAQEAILAAMSFDPTAPRGKAKKQKKAAAKASKSAFACKKKTEFTSEHFNMEFDIQRMEPIDEQEIYRERFKRILKQIYEHSINV